MLCIFLYKQLETTFGVCFQPPRYKLKLFAIDSNPSKAHNMAVIVSNYRCQYDAWNTVCMPYLPLRNILQQHTFFLKTKYAKLLKALAFNVVLTQAAVQQPGEIKYCLFPDFTI